MLDEIGISLDGELVAAPSGNLGSSVSTKKKEAEPMMEGGGDDDDLQKRLDSLRKG